MWAARFFLPHDWARAARETQKAARRRLSGIKLVCRLRMALGLGATGHILLEFGLFFANLGVAAEAVGVLEFFLGVHHIVQTLFALLAGEVVVATRAAALGKAILAVHLVVTGNAFYLGMHRVGEHDSFLRTLEFQRFIRSSRGSKSGQGQSKHHDTGKNQNFLHGRPP